MTVKEFCIVRYRLMYQPDLSGIANPSILCADGQTHTLFESIDTAMQRVDELDAEPYMTTSGESGRPEYYIVEHQAAMYQLESADDSVYDWSGCDCHRGLDGEACGECDECFRYIQDKNIEWVHDHAVNWTGHRE